MFRLRLCAISGVLLLVSLADETRPAPENQGTYCPQARRFGSGCIGVLKTLAQAEGAHLTEHVVNE